MKINSYFTKFLSESGIYSLVNSIDAVEIFDQSDVSLCICKRSLSVYVNEYTILFCKFWLPNSSGGSRVKRVRESKVMKWGTFHSLTVYQTDYQILYN